MKHSFTLCWLLLLGSFLFAQPQQELTLFPSQDNTLYETTDGSLGNGAGSYLFAGRTMQNSSVDQRRALLQFPVPDSLANLTLFVVDSVVLQLHVSQAISDNVDFSLHRLTQVWGEGATDAPGQEGAGDTALLGDATWLHAFSDTVSWANPGGDFVAEASATDVIGRSGFFTFTNNSGLVDDINFWFSQPDSNFGWILIGGEGQMGSAKRFDSRENSDNTKWPTLRIFYRLTQTSIDPAFALPFTLRSLSGRSWEISTELSPAERQATTLELLDLQGRSLHQQTGIGAPEVLAPSTLPAGLYLLRLRTEHGRLGVKKLMVRE